MQPLSSPSDRLTRGRQRLDSPGVRLPPPVVYLVAFLIGLALQARVPVPFVARPLALTLGSVLALLGALCIGTAIPAMLRGHGTLNTAGPSEALVTSGPYRYSRNPMYVGLALLYIGLATLFAVLWALFLIVPLVLYTQMVVILPEERYLRRAFGEAYHVYCARVRRWL
jgi:protein-S-isoprenylcysteine O-methyltransferase Ste14